MMSRSMAELSALVPGRRHAIDNHTMTWWPRTVVVLAGLVMCAALIGAYRHGGNIDEFATALFADPTIPLSAAWAHLWAGETNPPFFYLFARLWLQLTGPTLFERRSINLVPLAFLLAWFAYATARHPQHRPFLAGLALFAFTGKFFLWQFPDYRGYFSQYCAELVFLGAACIAYLEHDDRPDLFQLVALPFLMVIHQVTTIYTFVLLVPLIRTDLHRRLYFRAACLTVVACLAFIPLGLFSWLQLHQTPDVLSRVAWITPRDPISASLKILNYLAPAIGENWVALAVAGFVAFQPLYRPKGPSAALIRMIGGAAIAATVLVLIINSRHPLTVERYFSFVAVEVIVILALTVVPLLLAQPRLAALVTANAAIYVAVGAVAMARPSGWQLDAAIIAKLVAQCPDTRIHAGSLPINRAEQFGLTYVAGPYHLTLLPPARDKPDACPIIYWTEFRAPTRYEIARHHGDSVSAANDSAEFGLDAVQLAHTRAITTQTGIVLVVSAPDKSPDVPIN